MSGNTGRKTSASDDGERRFGQAVVVAVCIVSLVVAGALAPSVGSPFDDGPGVNASQLAAETGLGESPNGSGVPQEAREVAGKKSSSSKPEVIGSPDDYAVGGEQPLAGFRNQSGGIQFVVQAPENTYYRVGAYQSFDGYGWSRDGERTAFSGAVPGVTPAGDRMQAEVTLNTSAFAVPVPWKPTAVDGPTPLSVRDTGGIVPRQSLAPNQSFTVTAVQPTRDPAVLSQSGYEYPDRIEREYLGVSDNVSGRVENLADEITADATNPYEEARAIEAWLEANKEYSLNATTDAGRPVTRQFLFEMEEGYCQYFASSMAVMLRSQGIPARYVVGYAPGTEIGEDTYAVTGSKAHAWVEVYFEDVGWVRFDPTPSAGREQADESVASQADVQADFEESNVSDSMNVSEPGSSTNDSVDSTDGETGNETEGGEDGGETGNETEGGEDGGETENETDDGGDIGDDDTGNETNEDARSQVGVRLNRTAAPGADVTVIVTRGGEPVDGADVLFNDEYVGTTNLNGEVVATVPYTQNLTVRVTNVNGTLGSASESRGSGDGSLGGVVGSSAAVDVPGPLVAGSTVRFDADGMGPAAFESGLVDPDDDEPPENETSEEFEVTTDMTFALGSEPIPGEEIPVQVSIEGRPVPSARVSVDGEYVGETNESGWVDVVLPADRETVTVSARRDEVTDSASVALRTDVDVTVQGSAVPEAELRVRARFDGEPLRNANVSVDGERVALTDGGGLATVEVPRDANGTVTVTVTEGVLSGSASKRVVTNATIAFEDPPSPGEDVAVLVRAANQSVEDASVALDGEAMGVTNGSGAATISVPANATGNVTVTAEVGALSASREVDLFEPNVSVTPAYLVTLPGAPVTVNVTDDGEPVGGATVAVGDSRARTGENGTVEAGLPFRNAVTVSVTAAGATASTRLDWLFANLLGVLALGVSVVVVGVGSLYGRGRLGRVARRVRRFARRAGQAAMDALFAVASRLDDLLGRLPAVPDLVRSFVERLVRAPMKTIRALGAGLAVAVVAFVARVRAWLTDVVKTGLDEPSSEAEASTTGGGSTVGGEDASSSLSLAAAWRVLVDLVSPSRMQTRTPGEIARLAVEKGLPSEPVQTLTDAYRRSVYGGVEPNVEEVERAQRAADELERSVEPSGDEMSRDGEVAGEGAGEASGDGGSADGVDAVRTDGGDDS